MPDFDPQNPFEMEIIEFRLRSAKHAQPGYVMAKDDFEIDNFFNLHPGQLPRRRISDACLFIKSHNVIALFTHILPDTFELTQLNCFYDKAAGRFKLNIGFLDNEEELERHAQRVVIIRSDSCAIPEDIDVFVHHDNIATEAKKDSPSSNMCQLYPLESAQYIERPASPVRKLSEFKFTKPPAKPAR